MQVYILLSAGKIYIGDNMENNPYINLADVREKSFGQVVNTAAENAAIVKNAFGNAFDIVVRLCECGGKAFSIAFCDGLCDSKTVTDGVIFPLLSFGGTYPCENTLDFIIKKVLLSSDIRTERSLDIALQLLLRGNFLIFCDGESECAVVGVQNIPGRSVEEPDTEVQEQGSREGFTENVKVNLSLVRKRLPSVSFQYTALEIGKTGKTRVLVCFLVGKAQGSVVSDVVSRLKNAEFDLLPGSSYLRKTLDTKSRTMFTAAGSTERPDTFCAKLNEGKVGVLVDGTPFALVVPQLFIENFQSLDDYLNRPYYAFFMRLLRLASFIISVFLPGAFVAVCLHHQELLPDEMLYSIVMTESNTLFPLTWEALIIHFIYELVREAGLRMPKSVGHAVSIVGALVIGDAAVSAGLIGTPMLIIVALTAITSLVTSELYQPASVLRFLFIIIGGASGFYGIMTGAAVMIISLASVTDYGVAFLSPLTPFDRSLFRDTVTRAGSSTLGRQLFNINKLHFTEGRQ